MNPNIAIITYSCDRNSAMWGIMMSFMKKYWSDCPYRQVLLTDKDSEKKGLDIGFDDVIEYDSTWADMHKYAVKKLGLTHFIMWMDDIFIYEHVNTPEIIKMVEKAIERKALCLYLSTLVLHRNTGDEDFYSAEIGKAYCYSSQCGLWDSKMFERVIDDKWSAWDFERIGSLNARNLPGEILIAKNHQIKWDEGIFRGKWLQRGVELCEKEGIDISCTNKEVFSGWETFIMKVRDVIFRMAPNLVTKVVNVIGGYGSSR